MAESSRKIYALAGEKAREFLEATQSAHLALLRVKARWRDALGLGLMVDREMTGHLSAAVQDSVRILNIVKDGADTFDQKVRELNKEICHGENKN